MPGNPHVRFDEGRVGRIARCRPLSYSTVSAVNGSPRLWTLLTWNSSIGRGGRAGG
jgi:hypothetical protein